MQKFVEKTDQSTIIFYVQNQKTSLIKFTKLKFNNIEIIIENYLNGYDLIIFIFDLLFLCYLFILHINDEFFTF